MSAAAAVRPVICLAGPTGAGKSAAALALAERFGGVIINADSRQVYHDFPVITAQPSPEDRVRAPHRLYGFLPTRKSISAGRWVALARSEIEVAHTAGKLPIIVGGTGLYMRALFDGMADIPDIAPDIHEALINLGRLQGLSVLYGRLQQVDPQSAGRIHPNDKQRILRALEVFESTGKPLSWWHENARGNTPSWPLLRLGVKLELTDLTPLLGARIETMLRHGAEEEARSAMRHCADPAAPGWSGIGCIELFSWITGELDEAEMRRQWLTHTRAYAKRQLTWFRPDTRIEWFAPHETDRLLQRAEAFLRPAPSGTAQPCSGLSPDNGS